MAYKFLPHTADVKFEASANTLPELFVESSKALLDSMEESVHVSKRISRKIFIKGKNLENLLYNFLEEFIFLLDAEDFLTSSIKEISINESAMSLSAVIIGDQASNYSFSNEVKAVTYSELKIRQGGKKFVCTIVLDV